MVQVWTHHNPGVFAAGTTSEIIKGRIPGAIFAGPASTVEGAARRRAEAARISRDKEVVIYCGCCPWEKCPNVHPAYDELRKMGFSNLVVLLIPQDFAHDWIGAGFPVQRGH